MPVMVLAPTMAFTMASSVASTVAWKSGLMRSFDTVITGFGPGSLSAPALAVENARNMSPELLPLVDPVRASPMVARFASRFNCVGSKGASVAMTMMIEPISLPLYTASSLYATSSGISLPIGTPRIESCGRRPQLHCTSTPTVYPPCARVSTLEAVPVPPLNP